MTEDFDIWWKNYPRKINKAPAQKAYEKAVKKLKVDPTVLLKAVIDFAREEKEKGTQPEFIAHPATWLNQRRWENHEPQGETFTAEDSVAFSEPPTKIHEALLREFGPYIYHNWFDDMEWEQSDMTAGGGTIHYLLLNFPMKFKADYVNKTYGDRICQILPGRIEFVSRA